MAYTNCKWFDEHHVNSRNPYCPLFALARWEADAMLDAWLSARGLTRHAVFGDAPAWSEAEDEDIPF
jgi:hypothetical protein